MKKFTLWTETAANLQELTRQHFPSFHLANGVGVFAGTIIEHSTAIVIFSDDVCGAPYSATLKKVHELAESIKLWNNQISVLVTEEDVIGGLI